LRTNYVIEKKEKEIEIEIEIGHRSKRKKENKKHIAQEYFVYM